MYEWSAELEVGVDAIDAQHRELFRTANLLLPGGGGASPAEIPAVIAFLEEYVVSHFGMEEVYMRRRSYPGYPDHKNEHVAFISRFYDLRDEYDADGGGERIAEQLARFLGDWLTHHIGKADKALGAFLREAADRAPGPPAGRTQGHSRSNG